MARGQIPSILWGASFANTLSIGYALDTVLTYSRPRPGSTPVRGDSGASDYWDKGSDYVLEATIRWIPPASTTTPLATGWDGATGFDAFLRYCRGGGALLRFIPSAVTPGTYVDCYLERPFDEVPTLEPDGTHSVRVLLRSPAVAFTGY